MKTIKKAVAVTIAAIVLMTAWLSAQLYLFDGCAEGESDVCIWVSLSQQLLDFGLVPGDLVTYYNRSLVDLLLALPAVAILD